MKHQIPSNSSLNNPSLTHLLLVQLRHVSHKTRLRLGFSSVTSHSASVFVHGCVPLLHFMFLKLKEKKKSNILQRMILPISCMRKTRPSPVTQDPESSEGRAGPGKGLCKTSGLWKPGSRCLNDREMSVRVAKGGMEWCSSGRGSIWLTQLLCHWPQKEKACRNKGEADQSKGRGEGLGTG